MGFPSPLHGVLNVTIFGAAHLHHSIHGLALQALEKVEESLHLKGLPHSKLYATVDIGLDRLARTRTVKFHATNPAWNESFRIHTAHTTDTIVISIKDQLPVSAKVVGRAKIAVTEQFLAGEPIEGWFELFTDEGHKLNEANVHVRLGFTHVSADPHWGRGIMDPKFSGVPNTFFPLRPNCHVALYQNSHLSNEYQPPISLFGNERYEPARYWEDLYKAIDRAQYFVYVAGWSVNVSLTLVRDPSRPVPGSEGKAIGQLLKEKADQGLTVLVMVWQDRTSITLLGNAGLMKTHDTMTLKYFEKTKVKCFLCPRNPDPSLSAVQHVEVGTEFTHHQKTVIVDAEGRLGSTRKIVSFIGGIDLCDGRYDTEHHPLFRKLDTDYLHDFQQKNFDYADLEHGGPREPWHDLHSCVEGQAAWDVLANFEQRWRKQSSSELADALLEISGLPDIFPPPASYHSGNENSQSWSVQIFRSIDDASVIGFPEDPAAASAIGLIKGKNVTIERSIHTGYIEAIRRAKRFIYIENQYFFGSCFAWSEARDSECLNLVPIEIALKIASKVRAGERFCVYVVTPMWPEGKPDSDTVQAILYWNRLTMEMMYKIIDEAIEEVGMKGRASVSDYLNFYCLGSREIKKPGEYEPPKSPEVGSHYWRVQQQRRFLIYVHAKVMIVDDEYIIIGSANLNQRSLDGGRDTEIAHGSFQPDHINGPNGPARGHIYGFRMSLWYEHFASKYMENMDVFNEPESLACVRLVNKIAQHVWELYTGDEVVELPGHLLPFPVRVLDNGNLVNWNEDGTFPDTSASVKGKKSTILPPILTT
ncbi:phospholipase D alpha 1-like [Nymphaea colorata]|nr:phospholipase D alpha 1-like [Nymphaea colorata]